MFCPKCGTNLPDNTKFCTSCGHAFSNAPAQEAAETAVLTQETSPFQPPQQPTQFYTQPTPPPKKNNNKTLIIILVAVLAAVIIGVGGWLIYDNFIAGGDDDDDDKKEKSSSSQKADDDEDGKKTSKKSSKNSDDEDDDDKSSKHSKDEDKDEDNGSADPYDTYTSGKNWENEYLGIGGAIPSSWSFKNQSGYVLFAQSSSGSSMNIVLESASSSDLRSFDAEEYLYEQEEALVTVYESAGFSNINSVIDSFELDGEEVYAVAIDAEISGQTFYTACFVLPCESHIAAVSVGGFDSNEVIGVLYDLYWL